MIYTNFLIFIAAIFLYIFGPMNPETGSGALSTMFHLYGILLVLLGFWQFNRYKFMKLKAQLENDRITIGEAKKKYLGITNIHMILAIFAFAAEIFLFNLKYFLTQISMLGELGIFVNAIGIGVFILHLVMVWYWAFRAMGDTIAIGKSPADHVKANIKFNLVIVIPLLLLSLFEDVLRILSRFFKIPLIDSPLTQVIIFGFFIVVLTVFAPVLIKWLWDCKPLEDSETKQTIQAFCRAQGVKFRHIMSWNALNGGLVTAGVLGLIAPFRYLLITPELMKLLDKDELLGVVSHEVGHVKKKHLIFYLMFFLAFMFISANILQLTGSFILKSPFWDITVQDGAIAINNPFLNTPLEYFIIFIFLLLFILYFRFIFGYFMRNFEREADIYCFHVGVHPELLVSSFHKLEGHMGGEGKKSNWHHYTIAQRVNFLRTCIDNPDQIKTHEKKVKRSLRVFIAAMVILVSFTFYMYITNPPGAFDYQSQILTALENKIRETPDNPDLYSVLGQLYYDLEKWAQAKQAYETSIELKYRQPGVLNNLAWLLLKCPEEELLDPPRALTLARDAVELDEKSFHFLDTLAEAYFQNSMYKEAYYAARRAYVLATENRTYYEEQLKKMAKYYKKFKDAIKI